MQSHVSDIVVSTAGRDAGGHFLVLREDETFLWLANGKRRTLAKPKRKNKKHVQQTGTAIALASMTDKRLRTWLNEFAAAQ